MLSLPARVAEVLATALRPQYEFEPLEIRVRVGAPFIFTWPWLNLDALVLHLHLKALLGDLYYALPPKSPLPLYESTNPPIARDTRGFYLASVSHLENYARFPTKIYGKFDRFHADYMKTRRKKIDTLRGPFKSAAVQFAALPPQTVRFWCVGDAKALRELLRGLSFLGKKGAMGYGAVAGVEVEPAPEDWSVVKDGLLTRPIPLRFLRRAELVMAVPWQPPYWAKHTIEPCGCPFRGGELA